MKEIKRSKRTLLLGLILIILTMSPGCATPSNPQEATTAPTTANIAVETTALTEPETTAPTVPTETEPQMMGDYTLEDCKSLQGIYIAHEDGSFDRVPTGGYMSAISDDRINGMYIADIIVELIPVINRNTKLVLFSGERYHITPLTIRERESVICMEGEDGTLGYGRLYFSRLYVRYRNHEEDTFDTKYVNGIDTKEYFHEYENRNPTSGLIGFPKNEDITFGIVNGTSIVEETYRADATYYSCYEKDNDDNQPYRHWFEFEPTIEGYALIKIPDNIPTGEYILYYEYYRDGKEYYQATLLKWVNE